MVKYAPDKDKPPEGLFHKEKVKVFIYNKL